MQSEGLGISDEYFEGSASVQLVGENIVKESRIRERFLTSYEFGEFSYVQI